MLPQAIDDVLYDAFGQRQISTIFTQLNQYRVILEAKPELGKNADVLRSLYVRSQSGEAGAAVDAGPPDGGQRPLSVNHQGQFAAATLSFNPAPGVALGEAVTAIRRAERELTCRRGFTPRSRAQRSSFRKRYRASRC